MVEAKKSFLSSIADGIPKEKVEEAIRFRHWMHENAEGHLKEYNTQKKLREVLVELAGVHPECIKGCAGTGLIVDIRGTGQIPSKAVKSIAFRADIDGLEMQECNPDIEYASKTKYAHMCGHDGHTATLVLAAYLIW